jgi:phenylacetate-CoA ligase
MTAPSSATAWLTRDAFSSAGPSTGPSIGPGAARGLLLVSPDADVVVPLDEADRTAALDIAAATLSAAGITGDDRVVVALNNDGELTGALIARAAAEVAAAAAAVGPRGRMRLHHALETLRATTLIVTPTGAMDFLARLHLEFLIDPLDLELGRILLVGEIASPGCDAQLAAEFEAEVWELYADPFFGLPIAHRAPGDAVLTPVRESLLEVAAPDKDAALDPPYPSGLAELVVTPTWHASLGGVTLRTGQAARIEGGGDGIPSPAHTVGEHVLIRGRWVSIQKVAAALAGIDGITHWELRISRAGTLDAAAVHVTFGRDTLVTNPMWRSRIVQALTAITPVTIDVVVEEQASAEARPWSVTDLRGHHLGRDRTQLT